MSRSSFAQRRDKALAFIGQYRHDPNGFYRNILRFDPHEAQESWLLNSSQQENFLVTGNRWGKSTSAAAKRIRKCSVLAGWSGARRAEMLHKHEPYGSINIAPTADQSKIVWMKVHGMLQEPRAAWLVEDVKMTPFPTITFVTGAVFEARSTAGTGGHLLGHSWDDINWDEAALEKHFQEILDNVLRMRLVDRGGSLDYTSTGQGRNSFGLRFLDGLAGKLKKTYCQSGSSYENHHIDQAMLSDVIERMSARMRAQNVDGAIVDGGGDYFSLDDISACEDEMLNEHAAVEQDAEDSTQVGRLEVYAEPGVSWHSRYPDHRYMHGWDLADKKDRTVGFTLDLATTPWTIVEFEAFRRRGWDHVYDRIRKRQAKYGTPKSTKIDSTGLGDVVENELKDLKVEGFNFGGAGKKDALLENLSTTLSLRNFRMPFVQRVHNELAFYERDDEDLETDCVMGLGVLMWFAKHAKKKFVYAKAI